MHAQPDKKVEPNDLPLNLQVQMKKLFATHQYAVAVGKLVLDIEVRHDPVSSDRLHARIIKILTLAVEKQYWSEARRILGLFKKHVQAYDGGKTYDEMRLKLDEITIPEPVDDVDAAEVEILD